MHIRRMKPSDLPRVANVAAAAFKTDRFFNYICPHLNEYPDDFHAYFLRVLRKRLSQVGFICFVAELDDSDPEKEKKVVGIACWERVGDSETAKEWKKENSSLLIAFERQLQYAEEVYINAFVSNRSMDKKRISEILASLKDSFPREVFPEYWYLHILAIDPAFQRRGVGQMLAKWGVERAREERCCATLKASIPGRPMYEKLGFGIIKIIPSQNGSEPVPIMVWQPEDSKEDWVGKAMKLA